MPERKRVTLHPLYPDGSPNRDVNLYPKTLSTGIVDEDGNEFLPQVKLVSGVNIKTINGQSLLGSEDIQIDITQLSWGNITGNLSNQTDLQNALDSKEETITVGSGLKKEENTLSSLVVGRDVVININ